MIMKKILSSRFVEPIFIAILTAIWFLACASVARASECYSIRDYSARMECIAVERSEPASCLGVQDQDRRVICRQRAGRSKILREFERGPLDRR